jgi:hypothetical protein
VCKTDRRINDIFTLVPLSSNHRSIPRTHPYPTSSVSSATLSVEQIPHKKPTRKISLSAESKRRLRLTSTRTFQRYRVCRKTTATAAPIAMSSPPPPPHRAFVSEFELQYYTDEKLDPIKRWMSDTEDPGLLAATLRIISGRMICRHKLRASSVGQSARKSWLVNDIFEEEQNGTQWY